MDKLKAILFLPYLAPYRVDVLNELNKYYDLTVVFKFKEAREQNFNIKFLLDQIDCKYIFLERGFEIGIRPVRFGINNLLKKNKPDVVISNEFDVTSLLISIYSNFYNYIHISTTSDNFEIAKNSSFLRGIFRKLVLKTAKIIIVYNPDVAKWYSDNFSNYKLEVRVCPNIQNPKKILSGIDKIKRISEHYKSAYSLNRSYNYLYVGRLHEFKNIRALIKNFANAKIQNSKLIIIGEGPFKKIYEDLINSMNLNSKVLLLGRFEGDKLHAWYNLADLFVLPSIYEPFGAVVNESLIFGTPVLCSKYCGASFFITEHKNGIVFDSLNNDDFCKKLKLAKELFPAKKNKINLMKHSFFHYIKEYHIED